MSFPFSGHEGLAPNLRIQGLQNYAHPHHILSHVHSHADPGHDGHAHHHNRSTTVLRPTVTSPRPNVQNSAAAAAGSIVHHHSVSVHPASAGQCTAPDSAAAPGGHIQLGRPQEEKGSRTGSGPRDSGAGQKSGSWCV